MVKQIERKEFLSLLGMGGAAIFLGCVGGCSKGNGGAVSANAPSNVNFTIDISLAANAALQSNGGFVYANGIIVARTTSGQFIAVQQVCTHQSYSIVYEAGSRQFYCAGHGGTFSESGVVTGGPPPYSLTKYNTAINGNLLRVYS